MPTEKRTITDNVFVFGLVLALSVFIANLTIGTNRAADWRENPSEHR